MPLVLTSWGTSEGYTLAKLCDYFSWTEAPGAVLRQMVTPISEDLNDGYQVGRWRLSSNADGQGNPASISGLSTNGFLGGDRVNTYIYGVDDFITVGYETAEMFYYPHTDFVLVDPGWFYTDTGKIFSTGVGSGTGQTGIVDRVGGNVYWAGGSITNPTDSTTFARVIRYPTAGGGGSLFLETQPIASTSTNTLTAFGIPEAGRISLLFNRNTGGSVTTQVLETYDTGSQALVSSQTLLTFDTSLYPTKQYFISGMAYLRGDRAGKILVSGGAATATLTRSNILAEIDLDTLEFNLVAESEVRASTFARFPAIQSFGEAFCCVMDTRTTVDDLAQVTRIVLPTGATADNVPPDDEPTPDGGTVWERGDTPTTEYDRGAGCSSEYARGAGCSTSWTRGGC
jgi:hypothetical protein